MIKAVLQEEDIYTIESLVAKKGSKYLVKWENFPHDQNTWEPRSAIPPFIVKVSNVILTKLFCTLSYVICKWIFSHNFSVLRAGSVPAGSGGARPALLWVRVHSRSGQPQRGQRLRLREGRRLEAEGEDLCVKQLLNLMSW